MGFDASAGSVSLPGGGRWLIRLSHDAWNTTNAHLNLGSGLPEPQFGAVFTPNFKQYGYIGAAPLGTGNGVIYDQSVSLQGVTLAGQTSKTYDGLQSIGFTGLSLVNPSTKLPQVPQTGNSDNLSHATLQGGSAELDTANVGTGKTVRVLRVVYGGVTAPEGNNLTVYYSDLHSQNISGPVGTVLPASPSIDPPPQVPSDVPTQLSSTLLLLQQQPYGTSGAIVDAALRGQPTAWPSPLVPTDPVFGQRDRANEGVLAEGEICVR
jgi:hypothetical protein